MDNRLLISIRSFIISAGAAAAASFVGVYGVFLGASPAEMGFLQSTSTSVSNGGQILWGRISDRVGRRLPFLIMGSISLAALWFMMPYVANPVNLIIVYSLISLFGAMITVNWFAFIADSVDQQRRGRFLSLINNLSSVGTIISILAMSLFFGGSAIHDLAIPFMAASASYLISTVLLFRGREVKNKAQKITGMKETIREMRSDRTFSRYFFATTVQAYFWSMAWPMFPMTIVAVMRFNVTQIAYLTVASLSITVIGQYLMGRIVDRFNRVPLIFINRMMLCVIPLMYGFFQNLPEFLVMEIYSGFVGAIQTVVMTSYLLDISPARSRAQYISTINGLNGVVYLFGALSGGFLLQFLVGSYALRTALMIAYIIVFAGRLASSFLFLRLEEAGGNSRRDFPLFNILLRWKQPGNPSGTTVGPR